VHCGALQKFCGRLVGHSGALRCVAVQCGNVVEGLRQWTIAVHCGAMHMLWKAYAPLWYLAVPYGALRRTAYMLRKACGPLWCLVVRCGTVRKHCGRVTDHRGALRCVVYVVQGLQTVTVRCGALQCVAVHCGNVVEGLQTIAVRCISCRRLVDHCRALWSGVYVVDNLRTVMVPCSALHCRAVRCIALQKRFGRLLDHCGAVCTLQCTADTLQKAC